MKRFLVKLILFVAPFILAAVALEWIIRKIPNDYSYKHGYLDRHAEEIEVLVLGSSHGFYNVNPQLFSRPAFNAAHVSQSLKYDYFIFNKFLPRMQRLKAVLIPIHYRTLFFELNHDPEHWRANYYALYYGDNAHRPFWRKKPEIMVSPPIPLLRQALQYVVSKGSATRRTVSDSGFGLKFPQTEGVPLDQSALWAAERHTLEDRHHFELNIEILEQFAGECRNRNIQLILFSPPVFRSYMEHIDSEQYELMQVALADLQDEYPDILYLNLFSDERFSENDFFDADHLTGDGAAKLTELLEEAVSSGVR